MAFNRVTINGKKFTLVFPDSKDYFILYDESNNNRIKFDNSYLYKSLIELVEIFYKSMEYLQ